MSGRVFCAPLCLLLLSLAIVAGGCAGEGGGCKQGRLDCPCIDAVGCKDDLVCDARTYFCRQAVRCEDRHCVEHGLCQEAGDGEDARCLDGCEPGFDWDPLYRQCDPSPANCDEGAPTSILADCQAENRSCLTYPGGAQCGTCLAGFVSDEEGTCLPAPECDAAAVADCRAAGRGCEAGECSACLEGFVPVVSECRRLTCSLGQEPSALGGACISLNRECVDDGQNPASCGACYPGHLDGGDGSCRAAQTCGALDCGQYHRLCVEGVDEASCGDCRAGYEDLGGNCAPVEGLTCAEVDGLVAACAAEGRVCDPAGASGAQCGVCLDGTVEDPLTGVCIEPVPCSELDCAAESRLCDPEPSAHCSECMAGLVEDDAGFCRPPLTCDAITCGDWICLPAPAGSASDARCVSPCEGNSIWNGVRCVPCPTCDDPVMEQGVEDRPTVSGNCICRTQPGYFYSLANESGTVPCDADGDGWVRESARVMLESGDPVLIENTRCEIRTIERIVLHNDLGQSREVSLSPALDLFESVRNDDDQVLRIQWDRAQLSREFWGADEQGIKASVLNRFTKFCADPRADYNDNGYGDPYEFAAAPPIPGARPEYAPFNQYSYFLELHRGWYAPGQDPLLGAWHIEERPRGPEIAGGVPLGYPEGEEQCAAGADGCRYWRECQRKRDAAADSLEPQVGMDLATDAGTLASGVDWQGMNHHSQFKCLVIRDVVAQGSPQERTPEQAQAQFVLNGCQTDGPVSTANLNPAEPSITCVLPQESPDVGSAVWGAVPYLDYPSDASHSGYQRGCVNGCSVALRAQTFDPQDLRCPGLVGNTARCAADSEDYGRLICLEVMCDEMDNDGDGQTDEDAPDPSEECLTGEEATCCFTGQPGICNLGTVSACVGSQLSCEPPMPRVEVCDGLDNDCDGSTDEGLDGIPCASASHSLGLPADPMLEGVCRDRLTLCQDGVMDCLPRNTYQVGVETLCDGFDNDCDGLTDEDLAGVAFEGETPGVFHQPCQGGDSPSVGLCVTKQWRCVDGQAKCVPTDPRIVEKEECHFSSACFWQCDSNDNDCDGMVDEGNVCMRYFNSYVRVEPIAKNGHNMFSAGSEVDVTVNIEFHGTVNATEIGAEMSVEIQEYCDGDCWDEYCEPMCMIQYPVPEVQTDPFAPTQIEYKPIQGNLREIVGGTTFSLRYRDDDMSTDRLIDYWWGGDDDLAISITANHPAVRELTCVGLSNGLHTGLPEFNYFSDCDRRLCAKAYEWCFDQDYHPECADQFQCDSQCDEYDWECSNACFAGEDITGYDPVIWIMNCCDEHELGYDYTYCSASLRVEYTVWPSQDLCPGYPTTEKCDGCDNDHDGQVDESFAGMGSLCGSATGECVPGNLACVAGVEVCQGAIGPTAVEPPVCNGKDDDCDGQTDEGVREPCQTSCGLGSRTCGGGNCLAQDCPSFCGTPGYRACVQGELMFGACFYPEIPEEVCNGQDDDCDGETDESFPNEGDSCGSNLGPCVAGVVICQDGVELCDGEVPPEEEICDGLDNDCDGPADEIEDTGGCPCAEEGVQEVCGIDEAECSPGLRTCTAGQWTDCLGAVWPSDEICNGLDDDCDGLTDENPLFGPAALGQPCGADTGECTLGAYVCENGGLVCAGGVGPVLDICNGLDDDCDGEIDEVDSSGGCGPGSCFEPIELSPFPGIPDEIWSDTSEGYAGHESCNPDPDSAELVYHINLPGPSYANFLMHGRYFWPALYLRRDACSEDPPVDCVTACQGRSDYACMVQVPLEEGVDYYLFADGQNGDSGPFYLRMELSEDPQPLGDPGWCPPVTTLVNLNDHYQSGTGEWWYYSSTFSAYSNQLSLACAVTDSKEVVHEFLAPATGSYTFSTVDDLTALDTVLAVRSDCDDEQSTLACNDDHGGSKSQLTVDLAELQHVYVIVEGKGTATGLYLLRAWQN